MRDHGSDGVPEAEEERGLRVDPASHLKELEPENSRLEKVVADLMLDKAILIAPPGVEDPSTASIRTVATQRPSGEMSIEALPPISLLQ